MQAADGAAFSGGRWLRTYRLPASISTDMAASYCFASKSCSPSSRSSSAFRYLLTPSANSKRAPPFSPADGLPSAATISALPFTGMLFTTLILQSSVGTPAHRAARPHLASRQRCVSQPAHSRGAGRERACLFRHAAGRVADDVSGIRDVHAVAPRTLD